MSQAGAQVAGTDGRPSTGRTGSIVLAVILGFALLRGLFAVFTLELWSPVDESAHFAYVESIATGHGIPVTGRDTVDNRLIYEAIKADPVSPLRQAPVVVGQTPSDWGLAGQQFEAFQGPIYYALMVPFYWLGRPFGFLAAVYAVRFGSMLLTVAAVAVTYLAGRRIFPREPAIALAGAGALALLNSLSTNNSQVTNDALMPLLGAAALWSFAGLWRTPTVRSAATFGAIVAAAVVAKGSGLALAPMLTVGILALVWRLRRDRRSLARLLMTTAAGGAVVAAPWLAFNYWKYGASTGLAANIELTFPAVGSWPANWHTVDVQAVAVSRFVWMIQRALPFTVQEPYGRLWCWALGLAAVGGTLAALVRRCWRRAAAIAWLATGPVLGVGVLLLTFFVSADGKGEIAPRHLGTMLPAVGLALASGVVEVVQARIGVLVLCALSLWSTIVERPLVESYFDTVYLSAVPPSTTLVYQSDRNDGYVIAEGVALQLDCDVHYVTLIPPAGQTPHVTVDGSPALDVTAPGSQLRTYELPLPLQRAPHLQFDQPTALAATASGGPSAVFVEGPAEVAPSIRVFCDGVDNQMSFRQRFDANHPIDVPYRWTRWFPTINILAAALALAFAFRQALVTAVRRIGG